MNMRQTIPIVVLGLVFALGASAKELQQTDSSYTSDPSDVFVQQLGTGLYGTAYGVTARYLPAENITATGSLQAIIRKDGVQVVGLGENGPFASGTPIEIAFPIGAGYTFDPSGDYELRVLGYTGSGFPQIRTYGSAEDTAYSNGTSTIPGRDLYFTIQGAGYEPQTATATGTLSITSPDPGADVYEFDFWPVSVTSSVFSRQLIGVKYGTSSGVYPYEDFTQENVPGGSFDTFVFKTRTLVTNVNEERPWYFRAYLYDINGNVVASSTEVSAMIRFSFRNVRVPTSTATTTDYFFIERVCPDFVIGSSTIDAIACSAGNLFRKIGNEIFSGSTNAFNAFISGLNKVFPLSVFAHLKSDFDRAKAVRATSTDVSVPYLGTTYTFISSSTINNAASSIGFNWRGFTDKVMYVLTGLVIVLGALLAIKELDTRPR